MRRLKCWRQAGSAVMAAVMAGGVFVALAAPAGAVLTGGCTASGSLAKGTTAGGPITVDPVTLPAGSVVKIPLADEVSWTGSVPASGPDRPISGFVKIDLPWPLSAISFKSWGGDTSKSANSGTTSYDLPSVTPRGVVFDVSGQHVDQGVTCAGHVLVEVEGSAFDSPLTWAALGGTALSALGFAFAGRPKRGGA
jgi:hypothetical protein